MSRRVLAQAALAAILAVSVAPAQAGFLDELFGARPQPRHAPVLPAFQDTPLSVTVRPRRQRPAKAPVPTVEKPAPRSFPMAFRGDSHWYLRDHTLARGDIVVLPGGALVFDGGARTAAAFRPFEKSRNLSDRTRRLLRGMIAASPAEHAVWEPSAIMPSNNPEAALEASVRAETAPR